MDYEHERRTRYIPLGQSLFTGPKGHTVARSLTKQGSTIEGATQIPNFIPAVKIFRSLVFPIENERCAISAIHQMIVERSLSPGAESSKLYCGAPVTAPLPVDVGCLPLMDRTPRRSQEYKLPNRASSEHCGFGDALTSGSRASRVWQTNLLRFKRHYKSDCAGLAATRKR